MESDVDTMENIATLLDDNNILTYKWLSKEINVDLQKSKLLLKKFLNENANKENVCATYCIIGNEKKGNRKVLIVHDSDIDKVKSSLNSVTSQHVYSIQKVPLKNSSALYALDSDITEHTYKIEPTAEEKPIKTELKQNEIKEENPEESKVTDSKKNTSNDVKKTDKQQNNKQNNRNGKVQKPADKKAFFGNNKPKKASPIQVKTEVKAEVKNKRQRPPSNNKKEKTYQRIKRPRIESSSSSESENEDDDEDFRNEDIEKSPTQPESPQPEEVVESTKPVLMSKEVVNETFVDDDGYLVTKKTVKRIEEAVKPQETKPQLKQKPKPPQKKAINKKDIQQSTLTNFFKRK